MGEKTTNMRVDRDKMAWHVEDLQRKGWTMLDIKIGERSGVIKEAYFVNADGDHLMLQPKTMPRYNASRNGKYSKWRTTHHTYPFPTVHGKCGTTGDSSEKRNQNTN